MQTSFIPTNEYYHRILAAPDGETRTQLYLDLFVKPWQQMMGMMSAQPGAGAGDPLARARAWNWLLPEQVEPMRAMLEKLEAANAWQVGQAALERAAACFDPYADRIPFGSTAAEPITGWLMLADPARADAYQYGYTGATDWFRPRFIGQFWDPNAANLSRLPALVAHEMHHLIRMRLFPFGLQTSVADYIVIEGTAEAFAAALFGADKVGLFISEFDPAKLETARRLIAPALSATGFNVIRGYIFGEALAQAHGFQAVGGMPAYGGYAVGYHVVQAFLRRSGLSIEETTFLPADEIARGSGFFE